MRRIARRKKIARILLLPAITDGFQSTSLIKRPEVLQKRAQSRIAACPEKAGVPDSFFNLDSL